MKFAAFASLIILFGAGSAIAADTDAATVGRPSAVLSEASCVAAWHKAAGEEQNSLSPRPRWPPACECDGHHHELPASRH